MRRSAIGMGVAALLAGAGLASEVVLPLDPRDAELPRLQMPEEFALVFSFGYVQDFMPKDPAEFERMLGHMQRTGINTVHCKYTDWRRKLCEEHGLMMMVDLAVPEHDLKQARCSPGEAEDLTSLDGAGERFAETKALLDRANARIGEIDAELGAGEEAKAAALQEEKRQLEAGKPALEARRAVLIASNVKYICKQVRGSKGVWGYGLWYDNGTSGEILDHAIEKLRRWDPTHVTFVGSYRSRGLETVTINPGCYGWYDYHWERGTPWHYLDMSVVQDLCGGRNAIAGNYAGYSGLAKDLFTVNTCIASGVKMVLWFIGGPMNRDTHEWADDHELVPVAAEIRTLYRELMLIGSCTA